MTPSQLRILRSGAAKSEIDEGFSCFEDFEGFDDSDGFDDFETHLAPRAVRHQARSSEDFSVDVRHMTDRQRFALDRSLAEAEAGRAVARRLERDLAGTGGIRPRHPILIARVAVAAIVCAALAWTLIHGLPIPTVLSRPLMVWAAVMLLLTETNCLFFGIDSPTIRFARAVLGISRPRPVGHGEEPSRKSPDLPTLGGADLLVAIEIHAPDAAPEARRAVETLDLCRRARDGTGDLILRDRLDGIFGKVDALGSRLRSALEFADAPERRELAAAAVGSLITLAAAADDERALVQKDARDLFEQQRRYIDASHPDVGVLRPIP